MDSRLHIILQRYSRRNGGRGTSTRNHHRNGRRTSLPDRLRGDGRGTPLLYDVDAVRENLTNPFPESPSLCRDAGAERRWRDPVSLRGTHTSPSAMFRFLSRAVIHQTVAEQSARTGRAWERLPQRLPPNLNYTALQRGLPGLNDALALSVCARLTITVR